MTISADDPPKRPSKKLPPYIRRVGPGEARRFPYGDHVDCARQLVAELEKTGPVVFSEGSMWRYTEAGIYARITEAEESVIVQGFSGEPTTSEKGEKPLRIRVGDVRGAIALAHHMREDVEFFSNAPTGIAFSNGFVRVAPEGATIFKHSANHRARFSYPFTYDPSGPASRQWLKLLYGIFRDDADREERILLIHEFFGGCLLGLPTRHDKAIFLQGNGDDGKSTLLEIFRAAFPPDTCSAVPPHKLSGYGGECDYFRAQLVGKLANMVSELPEADLLESTGFKAIVSGDVISARVPCRPAFSYRPVAGHIFAANELPAVGDMTRGFWRRIIVIPFTRTFDNDPERDPLIADAIIAREIPGVVAMMIAGAVRLMSQSGYTVTPSSDAAAVEWQVRSDPVRQWIADGAITHCVASEGDLATDLYRAYAEWAKSSGHKVMAKITFGKRLNRAGYESLHTKFGWRYPLRRVERAYAHHDA